MPVTFKERTVYSFGTLAFAIPNNAGSTEVGCVVSVCAETATVKKTQKAEINNGDNNLSISNVQSVQNVRNQLPVISLAGKLRVIFKGFC